MDQMTWLSDIDFTQVDVVWKYCDGPRLTDIGRRTAKSIFRLAVSEVTAMPACVRYFPLIVDIHTWADATQAMPNS